MFQTKERFAVYITTNKNKTVLYTGITNDLESRIIEHYMNRNNKKTFAGRYNAYFLIYYESFAYVRDAIAREKQIKDWRREKKVELIDKFNPNWELLNERLFGYWPPPPHKLKKRTNDYLE